MRNRSKQWLQRALLLILMAVPAFAQTSTAYRKEALAALRASEIYLTSPQHSDEQAQMMNRLNHTFIEKYRSRRSTKSYVQVSAIQTQVTMAVIAQSAEAAADCHRNIEKLRVLIEGGH